MPCDIAAHRLLSLSRNIKKSLCCTCTFLGLCNKHAGLCLNFTTQNCVSVYCFGGWYYKTLTQGVVLGSGTISGLSAG